MDMTLHFIQDDWALRFTGDLERAESDKFAFDYYLIAPNGDRLTDPQGNYLVARFNDTIGLQTLHFQQEDLNIRME